MVVYPDLGFLDEGPGGVLVEPPGDAGLWLEFCYSRRFYMILFGGKSRVGS